MVSRFLGVLLTTTTLVGLVPPPVADASPRAAVVGKQAHYSATITRTRHGIPHIVARNFAGLGFGSGYAAAQTSICTLADTLLTARGQRSRYLGAAGRYNDQVTLDASNLQVDAFVADLHQRHVVENLMATHAGPGRQARAMVRGYTAGVNKWVATHTITDPACKGAAWIKPDATPKDLWYGIYLANLLASAGVFVKEIVDARPPAPGAPIPALPKASAVDRAELLKALGKDPQSPFGSNATAVGGAATTTHRGMLLGNPHFPWRGRYRFTQQQLTIPGKYDVAGASLIGSPVVNIGWNRNVAWSHTVSTAYRFTPYEYRLVGPTTILTEKGPTPLMHDTVSVTVKDGPGTKQVAEDLWRTHEGFVVDSSSTLMPWTPASVWAIRDANGEQLRTIDTFLNMGKATGVRDLLRRQDRAGGMPWVNTTAADRRGNVLYADHSVVPNVSNAMAQQCKTPVGNVLDQVAGLPGLDGTRAQSSCNWGTDADAQRPGIFGPSHLPSVVRRDWVTNANDSYWLPNPKSPLTGFAHIIGCEQCERTLRTRMVDAYVMDRLAGRDRLRKDRKESLWTLARSEHLDRVRGAELMKQGGALDRVCQLAQGGDACTVLHAWNATSRRDSRGNQIYEEFMRRAPTTGLWLHPFDAADPLNTPNTLNVANPQVISAMRDAIAALRARHIPMNATWGSLQVAGDRGAPAIGLGGGEGDLTGNANALASRWPVQNTRFYKPVTYGSSHIQAVAFRSRGRVRAWTILTYGQSENPRSAWSRDQTRMYADGRWLHFPFTQSQIRRARISVEHIIG